MIHLLCEHGMNQNIYKKCDMAVDQKQDIKEQTNTFDANSVLNELVSELQEYFEKCGYSVEVDQYKNIKGLGFYMTISKKKNSPGLCVVSIFYSDDLNKFSVSYRRSVKFFESPEEVIRYVKGLHIVCESMSRKIDEDVNSPDYCKDGFDTRFRYMDGISRSCSSALKEFLDSLGKSVLKYRFDNDKKGNPDLIRLAAKSDVKTWFKILDFLRDNDCYVNKTESRRSEVKLRINESGKQLMHEEDAEIEVKNPGILEVPEGKKVNDLPQSHFEKLAKNKGLGKITKALNNLQVWNKNDDPELSKWAGNMIDKLNKKLKKDESYMKLRETKYGKYDSWMHDEAIDALLDAGFVHEDDNYFYQKTYDCGVTVIVDEETGFASAYYGDSFGGSEFNIYDCDGADYGALETVDDVVNMDRYFSTLNLNEAATKRGRKRSTGSSNSVGSFLDRQIASGKIDEKQITVVYDKNNNIMWLGKAGFYPLYMSNIEYRSSGYDKDHPHEFWINARSYTEPFGESYKKQLTINESPMDYLDTNERAIVDKLEQLGYRGSKPIKFDGKLMGYWDKVYYTDKKSSSGVQIYIDPFDGSVEVQEFVNDVDAEDLTDLCPVKNVGSPNDVVKIDKWAKGIKKSSVPIVREDAFDDDWDNFTKQNPDWEDEFNAIFDKPWYGYLFESTMTDSLFAIISQNEQAVFDYGKRLAKILSRPDHDAEYDEFITDLPSDVILTDPENDTIRFDRSIAERGMWCVDMDNGYGDTIVFNEIGDFKGRF